MTRLQEQLTRLVKFSSFFREGSKEDEDKDLTEIDRALEKAVDEKLNEAIDSILERSSTS